MAMNLYEYIQDAYDHPVAHHCTTAVASRKIRIDDLRGDDVYIGYCDIFVTANGETTNSFSLILQNVPWNQQLEDFAAKLFGTWQETKIGRTLTLHFNQRSSPDIRNLAQAIRKVTGRGQQYDDRNWKWITRRTADSLDRFARHLREYRRLCRV